MLQTNFRFGEVHRLVDILSSAGDKVQFKGVFSNDHGGVALLAFKSGQRLDTHTAPAEVMVYVLEGEITFTMADNPNVMRAGDFLLMGEGVEHNVLATADSKVMLIKIKPE